jgi:hypothetical protein
VTTVNTEQLASMLETQKPLVIDTMDSSWYRSVPGAVGLNINGHTNGTFTDAVQKRLEQKLRALTGGDMAKPIVAMAFNVARFDGYNLALRLRHAGYTNVYLVPRRPGGVGGSRHARGRGAAGRLVIPRNARCRCRTAAFHPQPTFGAYIKTSAASRRANETGSAA